MSLQFLFILFYVTLTLKASSPFEVRVLSFYILSCVFYRNVFAFGILICEEFAHTNTFKYNFALMGCLCNNFYFVIFFILSKIKTLNRAKESDTYLTRVSRHHWSRKSPVKLEQISGAFSAHWFSSAIDDDSHSVGWKLLIFSPGSFCSSDIYRRELVGVILFPSV